MARLSDLPPEVQAYYVGGKRVTIGGIPTRVAAHYGKAPGVDAIKAAVAAGSDLSGLPEAPRFAFTARDGRPLDNRPPSPRGAAPAPKAAIVSSWWRPARISLEPNYTAPMRGDDWRLTAARKAWARGNPKPLREWLERGVAISEPRKAA